MKDSVQVSKENYLKAILEAEAERHHVIPAMLAHWLEVSAPAAGNAITEGGKLCARSVRHHCHTDAIVLQWQ